MGEIERFRGKTVFIDSMPFIYFIEEHPLYIDKIAEFFDDALRNKSF